MNSAKIDFLKSCLRWLVHFFKRRARQVYLVQTATKFIAHSWLIRYLLKMNQKQKATARVLKEALQMEPDDRAMLAERLISSLEPEADPEIERSWQKEIQKRLKDSQNNHVEFLSWDEVRRKIKRTYYGSSR